MTQQPSQRPPAQPRRPARVQAPTSQLSLDAERACRAAGITDPVTELPLLAKLAEASRVYRTSTKQLAVARKAWEAFASTNAHDDPVHEEHRQRVIAARSVQLAADEEFSFIEHQLAVARGEVSAAPVTAPDRLAFAKRLVAAAEGRA